MVMTHAKRRVQRRLHVLRPGDSATVRFPVCLLRKCPASSRYAENPNNPRFAEFSFNSVRRITNGDALTVVAVRKNPREWNGGKSEVMVLTPIR